MDAHDMAVVEPSCLGALVASAASAARRGGELTFADPCEALRAALEAMGLAHTVRVSSHRRLRSLAPPSPGADDGGPRRAAMAQHPAGTPPINHPTTGAAQ